MPTQPPKTLEELLAAKRGLLNPYDTIQKAGDVMRELNVEALPVSEGHRLVGMVEDLDPDRKAAGHGHDPNDVTIAESMTRDVVYCFEDEGCEDAFQIMRKHGLQNLPIVDREKRVVGMLTRDELEAACKGRD